SHPQRAPHPPKAAARSRRSPCIAPRPQRRSRVLASLPPPSTDPIFARVRLAARRPHRLARSAQLAPVDDPAPEARRVRVENLDLGAALLDHDLVVIAADADRDLRIGRQTGADARVARLVVRGVLEVADAGLQIELVQIAAAALR